MDENGLANLAIGAAIEVHRELGPGLLESAYQDCLKQELKQRGIGFQCEVPVSVRYKGHIIGDAYRVDLIIGNKLVVELKSVEELKKLHRMQLLTYLRLLNRKLGLLMNFNSVMMKDGICRVVNKL